MWCTHTVVSYRYVAGSNGYFTDINTELSVTGRFVLPPDLTEANRDAILTAMGDCGRAYPLYPLSASQVNQVSTAINPLDLLPNNDLLELLEFKYSCSVVNLTPRTVSIWDADGAQFLINYWQPFNQDLYDWLTTSIQVQAFEFIGERIKYSRLQRMLDNV